MTETAIHELRISYPDSFHEMSADEMSGMRFYKDRPGAAITDPEKHIIVTAGWKKSGFAALLLSEKDAAKKAEQSISAPMKAYGYQLEGFSGRALGGEKACGYRYHYKAKDTEMTGETFAVKHNKAFYYLNFYTRTALLEENLAVWSEMLDSIRWEEA